MSTLGDSLWQQYGGDRPSTPQQVARDAIQRYGSGRAAGRALGVDEAQIRRWRDGKVRHSANVDRVARALRAEAADRRDGPVRVKFRYARRDRDLSFRSGDAGRTIRPAAEAEIRAAYVAGDREGMAKSFVSGLTDPWYRAQLGRAYRAEIDGAPGDAGEDSGAVGVFSP